MKKILPPLIIAIVLIGLGIAIYVVTKPNNAADTITSASPSAIPATPTSSSSTAPRTTTTTPQASGSSNISAAELAKNNGKNGAKCWVAVNGKVYNATGNRSWVNGVHTQSNGQAVCGGDMSSVIGDSPHGTSVLSELPVIGNF